ncbi:MAG: hypothetical protein WC208_16635 [Gallionella sp.]|jgi:hypothetical protein
MVNNLPKRMDQYLDIDKIYDVVEPPLLFTRPHLLFTDPIPPALHGQNPRTIKGREWWDIERRKIYKVNNHHCFACGAWSITVPIKHWLEAHEVYKVNIKTGKVILKEIVALCYLCHNFIHIGRLSQVLHINDMESSAIQIVEHGLNIVRENNVKITNEHLAISEYILNKWIDRSLYKRRASKIYALPWSSWYLYFEKKRYYSLFHNEIEWRRFYNSANQPHLDTSQESQDV